jgi:hypothetical protein
VGVACRRAAQVAAVIQPRPVSLSGVQHEVQQPTAPNQATRDHNRLSDLLRDLMRPRCP